jgi:acetoin utilization deacetylase AcuC-like enzyme
MSEGRVVVLDSERFSAHTVDPQHPERPARNDAVRAGADALGDRVERREPRPATLAEVERVHHPRYVDEIASTESAPEPVAFDDDTAAHGATYATALLAAGSAIGAVDAAFEGSGKRAFSLARPPGHHAEVDRAMGYCFFNSIAIAAEHALAVHRCQRVAIVDWDVHHGNGTQRAFEGRSDVLFVSSHQYKLFPGTGHYADRGRGRGKGYTVNLSIGYEATDDEIVRLHQRITVPIVEEFAPDLLLVSAGFDAHEKDHTADQKITSRGFGRLGTVLFDLADRVCGGRCVLVLEGGYSLEGLTESVTQVLEAAIDPSAFRDPVPPAKATQAMFLEGLVNLHAPDWPSVRRAAAETEPTHADATS